MLKGTTDSQENYEKKINPEEDVYEDLWKNTVLQFRSNTDSNIWRTENDEGSGISHKNVSLLMSPTQILLRISRAQTTDDMPLAQHKQDVYEYLWKVKQCSAI